MKTRINPFFRTAVFAPAFVFSALTVVHAATGTWTGAIDGTWDTTGVNWSGVSGTPWDNTNGPDNTATFNTASLAAVVSGPVFTNGITFSTTGALSGSTINFVGTTPGIAVATGQTGTISSIIAGSAGLVKSDAGLLTLSGSNTYTGGTTVSSGRLKLVDNKTGSSNFIINGELEYNLTFGTQVINGGIFSGTGNLIKTGAGTMYLGNAGSPQAISLTGANSVIDVQDGLMRNEWGNTGWTDNKAGLNIGSAGRFELHDSANTIVDEVTGTGLLTKNNIGGNHTFTIGINNGTGTFSGTIVNVVGGLFIVKEGSGTQTFSGAFGVGGKTTVNAGTLVMQNLANSDLNLQNANFTSHATLEFNVASGAETWLRTGTIDGTGNVVKTGAGMLSLSRFGPSQFISLTGAGSIFEVQEGTVRNDWGNSNGWNGNFAGLRVASGATFNVWDGATMTADELTGAGSITKTQGGANVFTIGVNNGNGTFSGTITNPTGTISLIKQGSGTQTLSGSGNTYTGTTAVEGGALIINAIQSSATGAVSVSNAGTRLMGTGTIGGATTINTAAIHSAGNGIGVVGNQTFSSSLTFGNGSIFEWDIDANSNATGFDTVAVTGDLNGSTGGDISIFRVVFGTTAKAGVNDPGDAFWNTSPSQVWSMTSLFGKNFTSGLFTSVETYDSTGIFDVSSKGAFTISGSSLTWTAVPEPSSALVGLLVGAGLVRRRRR